MTQPAQIAEATRSGPFLEAAKAKFYSCVWALPRNNYDHYRFGPEKKLPLTWRCKAFMAKYLYRLGLLPSKIVDQKIGAALSWVQPYLEDFEWLYQELADSTSRDTLIDVVAYRSLGYRHVKLELNTPKYWKDLRHIESVAGARLGSVSNFPEWSLREFKVEYAGQRLRIAATPKAILTQFKLDQYECQLGPRRISASTGETALDCGGCWGDTALNLACRVGATGKVHSFEFMSVHCGTRQVNGFITRIVGQRAG